jgi:hypothetical protein
LADLLKYDIGDVIELKKPHPCGSKMWKILKVGVDYRLECEGCGHIVLIPRIKLYKMIKNK